jgi:hypothetical protein
MSFMENVTRMRGSRILELRLLLRRRRVYPVMGRSEAVVDGVHKACRRRSKKIGRGGILREGSYVFDRLKRSRLNMVSDTKAKLARLQGQSREAYSPNTTKALTSILSLEFRNNSWEKRFGGHVVDFL